MEKPSTVFVGMSGGVDSSVAAARLKNSGYDVVGVFIKVWHPEFMVCDWEEERLDAMRVAAHLEIPFLTCDARQEYYEDVAQYFIEEYKQGRTPNPDVMCNQKVKFGAFLRFAKERGADYIATGHYAQKISGDQGAELHRGVDQNKDQTYFLWTLSKEQLEYSLFPIGDIPKDQVRKEAEELSLPTAEKKDSQGICFLGHVDIPEFISHFVELKSGDVLNTNGNTIGSHKGALVYTLGQRHGFTLNTEDSNRPAYYVVDRDTKNNTITVSTEKLLTKQNDQIIKLSNLVLRTNLDIDTELEAQFRYRQAPFTVRLTKLADSEAELRVDSDIESPAAGQSCVLYHGTHCVGGGIIE